MTRHIEIRLSLEDADDILKAEAPEVLKARIRRALKLEATEFETNTLIAQEQEERRRKRAESHTLTKRQAEAMCAAKWGKSPARHRPEKVVQPVHLPAVKPFKWKYVRGMGGAAYRMIDTLVEEGMIAANRMDLTDAGKLRLEAWEAKHGVLYAE